MSGWIQIGELSPPALSPDAKAVRKYFIEHGITDFPMKKINVLCAALKMSLGRALDAVYEVRKVESIMAQKLDNTQKAAIYQARQDGQTLDEIAKKYGVCPQTVANICQRIEKDSVTIAAAELPAVAEQPEPEKKPVATVNKEFDAAVDEMIADAHEKFADAEKNSAITAPDKREPLPPVVLRAVNQHLKDIAEHIDALRYRIDEIELEIEEFQKDAKKLEEWKEQQKWR